jgi:hypothetical protein
MSDFEQPAEPSTYGTARRAAWMAQLQANADAMTEAAVTSHQADHDIVTAGQVGIFGAGDPRQRAAELAARPATVGEGASVGIGRPLQRNGHLAESISPAPARVYASQIKKPGQVPDGLSPLAQYMRDHQ